MRTGEDPYGYKEKQGVLIEVNEDSGSGTHSSLADAFRAKRQDRQNPPSSTISSGQGSKRSKTKEELAEIRKQMMKRPSKGHSSN
jgi:hypothetical protein